MKILKALLMISSVFALSACQVKKPAQNQTTPTQQAVLDRAKDLQSLDPTLNEGEAIKRASVEAVFLFGWMEGKDVKAKREQEKFEEQLAKLRTK